MKMVRRQNFADTLNFKTPKRLIFDLFGCPLKTLPVSMKRMTKLRYLNVYDCFELDWAYETWFPEEVWRCGAE